MNLRRVGQMAIILAGVLCLGLQSAAWAKVAVLDTAKVLKEYKKMQEAQTRLEKDVEDKKTELKKMSADLEKDQNDLAKQKGIVSEAKYKKLEVKFETKQDELREKYREMQNELMKQQKTMLEGFLNDVKDVAGKIAKKEKYDLVMDKESVLYYDGDDITYKVLDKLNSN